MNRWDSLVIHRAPSEAQKASTQRRKIFLSRKDRGYGKSLRMHMAWIQIQILAVRLGAFLTNFKLLFSFVLSEDLIGTFLSVILRMKLGQFELRDRSQQKPCKRPDSK